jgi:hypothetical protein
MKIAFGQRLAWVCFKIRTESLSHLEKVLRLDLSDDFGRLTGMFHATRHPLNSRRL